MTVTYNAKVATIRRFGVFRKLLLRWRGSIYKLVWLDLLLYIVIYFILNLTYRLAMSPPQRKLFEDVARYCAEFSTFIPMSFVLGFYVTIVVQRWWEQYMILPWPDALAVYISTNINGNADRSRIIRRTIMRYVNLSFTYTMSQVCSRVKKRFPTLNHFVDAGLMTAAECVIFDRMNSKTPYLNFCLPLVWAGSIVCVARKEGLIRDDFAVKTIIDTINSFRSGLGNVLNYDWVTVPLVYTQTVTLAVYTFFIAELMGRQFVSREKKVDLYFPIFTFLQFFFFMGWLRVAETLFNPYGEDDDDFEINWMIDRNIQISYLIVDEMHNDYPDLVRDLYWEEVIPTELPYTLAAEQYRREPPLGSAAHVEVNESQMLIVEPEDSNEIERHDTIGSLVRTDIARMSSKHSDRFSRSAMDIPNSSYSSMMRYKKKRHESSKTPSVDSRSSVQPSVKLKRSLTNLLQRMHFTKDSSRSMAAPDSETQGVSRAGSVSSVRSRGQQTVSPSVPVSETAESYPAFVSEIELIDRSESQLSLGRRSYRASTKISGRLSQPHGDPPLPPMATAHCSSHPEGGPETTHVPNVITPEHRTPSVSSVARSRNSSSADSKIVPRFLPDDYHFLLPVSSENHSLARTSPLNPVTGSQCNVRGSTHLNVTSLADIASSENFTSGTDIDGAGVFLPARHQSSPGSALRFRSVDDVTPSDSPSLQARNRQMFAMSSSDPALENAPDRVHIDCSGVTLVTVSSPSPKLRHAPAEGSGQLEAPARPASGIHASSMTERLPVLYEYPQSSTETVFDNEQPPSSSASTLPGTVQEEPDNQSSRGSSS